MRGICIAIGIFSTVAFLASPARCQEEPARVSLCQVKSDPSAYNHKLLEITGFVSHGFEVFNFFDPACSSSAQGVWLEYGGKSKSGTMYCCGVTADKHRSKQLVIESIPIPLIEDDLFHRFEKLVQPPVKADSPFVLVQATLVGRFFAGKQIHYPKATFWGGFGHMGCCSLFAIQQVKSVSPKDRADANPQD